MAKTPDPTRVVADADVLTADVFVDGTARIAMERIRRHSWLELIASEVLLDDAKTIISHLGDHALAEDWYALIEPECHIVEHPPRDNPALGSAYAGSAGHLLTYDEALASAKTGVQMRRAMPISVRTPDAFVQTVAIDVLYEATVGDTYPGPDVEPRA